MDPVELFWADDTSSHDRLVRYDDRYVTKLVQNSDRFFGATDHFELRWLVEQFNLLDDRPISIQIKRPAGFWDRDGTIIDSGELLNKRWGPKVIAGAEKESAS